MESRPESGREQAAFERNEEEDEKCRGRLVKAEFAGSPQVEVLRSSQLTRIKRDIWHQMEIPSDQQYP
jgi:hypothetical protein